MKYKGEQQSRGFTQGYYSYLVSLTEHRALLCIFSSTNLFLDSRYLFDSTIDIPRSLDRVFPNVSQRVRVTVQI